MACSTAGGLIPRGKAGRCPVLWSKPQTSLVGEGGRLVDRDTDPPVGSSEGHGACRGKPRWHERVALLFDARGNTRPGQSWRGPPRGGRWKSGCGTTRNHVFNTRVN